MTIVCPVMVLVRHMVTTWSAHLALAELHDGLGHADAARRHTRESLDLAVAQLKQLSGGRRRTPL